MKVVEFLKCGKRHTFQFFPVELSVGCILCNRLGSVQSKCRKVLSKLPEVVICHRVKVHYITQG